jgi:hypothetical protein
MQEYPNDPGAGQPYSSSDSANLLTFFTYLRISLGSSKLITATSPDLPWKGSNGQPLTDVSAYMAQINYVNIMCATPGAALCLSLLLTRAPGTMMCGVHPRRRVRMHR